jgi:hypothetical protein
MVIFGQKWSFWSKNADFGGFLAKNRSPEGVPRKVEWDFDPLASYHKMTNFSHFLQGF